MSSHTESDDWTVLTASSVSSTEQQFILLLHKGRRDHTFTVSSDQSFKSDWQQQCQPGKRGELCTPSSCCLTCGCSAILTVDQYNIQSTGIVFHLLWEGGQRRGRSRKRKKEKGSADKWRLIISFILLSMSSLLIFLIKYHPWFKNLFDCCAYKTYAAVDTVTA